MSKANYQYNPKRPWKTGEAASWLGLSDRYLLQLVHDGVVPARKAGGVWYFDPRQLAEFAGIDIDILD